MNTPRFPWHLLIGLALGVMAGLAYAWLIRPVEYVDTAPSSLRADYKDQYRSLIAAAYQSNGDASRARARLSLLGDANPAGELAAQAQRSLAEGGAPGDAQALAKLAAVVRGAAAPTGSITAAAATQASATPIPATPTKPNVTPAATTGTPARQMPSQSPSPSPTETRVPPTRTPSITPGAPFVLASKNQVCDPALPGPLIQVQVNDAAGQPVAGVEVSVTWNGGEDSFFTGLKPDVNLGYADYSMTAGTVYTLTLGDGGQPVSGLQSVDCTPSSGPDFQGGWLLKFTQP
jgi:hypothetical protein